jgi:transposase
MILDLKNLSIYVKPGGTDMRKQINGLASLVQEELQKDPFSGSLFLFCNKQRKLLKILYWERNGFCLWLKRLERDRFPWPNTAEQSKDITVRELGMLLDGIDFWKAHEKLHYSTVF